MKDKGQRRSYNNGRASWANEDLEIDDEVVEEREGEAEEERAMHERIYPLIDVMPRSSKWVTLRGPFGILETEALLRNYKDRAPAEPSNMDSLVLRNDDGAVDSVLEVLRDSGISFVDSRSTLNQ